MGFNVPGVIHTAVSFQGGKHIRFRFKGDYSAAAADQPGKQERIQALVRAYVHNRHPRSDLSLIEDPLCFPHESPAVERQADESIERGRQHVVPPDLQLGVSTAGADSVGRLW